MKNILALLFTLFTLASFAQTTNFVGIGVKLEADSTTLGYKVFKITEFIKGGAAETSGLKAGDLILKIDDQSAVRIPIENLTKMIKGEVGSTVKVEVNRQGSVKTFSMARKKIEVPYQYVPVVKSDFCNALTKLLNDAPYHFRNIIDTISAPSGSGFSIDYPCKVNLPDTKSVVISRGFGSTSCIVTVGAYKTKDEINAAGEKTILKIKECYPKLDYLSSNYGDGKIIEAVLQDDKGYTSPIMSIYTYRSKTDDLYHLQIRIEDGEMKLFLTNKLTPQNNDFANALRTIYGEVENGFNGIKTTEHESGGLFNTSYWYDVNVKIPGAADCYVYNGDLTSMAPPQCIANFFLGEKEVGKETLMKFSEIIITALGSDFVYTPFPPEQLIAQIIPSSAEEVYTFAKKTRKGEESVPVMSLVFNKEEDGRYRIYLSFYKTFI